MQTAQLIKMICVISNYPTNTMQTSREDCRGPHCLEPFLPQSWAGRGGSAPVGGQMSKRGGGPLEFIKTGAGQAYRGSGHSSGLVLQHVRARRGNRGNMSHWWPKEMNYWLSPQFLTRNTANQKPPTVSTSPFAEKAAGASQPAPFVDSNAFGGPTCNINVWRFRGVEKKQNHGPLVSQKMPFSPKNI